MALDLTSADTTPSFSYIIPNACHDGSDTPCADGAPAGMVAADDWLKTTVPTILKSKAYADGGLLAITFDQAPQTATAAGTTIDSSQCCTPSTFPNLPSIAAPASTATPGTTAAPASTVLPATTAVPASTTDPASTTAPPSTTVPAVTDDSGSSPGGGKVGMLIVSDAVKPGSTDVIDSFNHFAFLKSIEDLFALDHLGYAADPAMPAFGKAVYTNSFKK
jgi:hypothetical protein